MKVRYRLRISDEMIGTEIVFSEFPDLIVVYEDSSNNLCPSRYDKNMQCFWEGDIILFLNVNGMIVEINDHDERKKTMTPIFSGNDEYIFQGLNVEIVDRKKDQTFLIFTIQKIEDFSRNTPK